MTGSDRIHENKPLKEEALPQRDFLRDESAKLSKKRALSDSPDHHESKRPKEGTPVQHSETSPSHSDSIGWSDLASLPDVDKYASSTSWQEPQTVYPESPPTAPEVFLGEYGHHLLPENMPPTASLIVASERESLEEENQRYSGDVTIDRREGARMFISGEYGISDEKFTWEKEAIRATDAWNSSAVQAQLQRLKSAPEEEYADKCIDLIDTFIQELKNGNSSDGKVYDYPRIMMIAYEQKTLHEW